MRLGFGNAMPLMGFLLLGASVAGAQGIYTCVDAKGRRITSDRPIADCTDRVQRELNPSGTLKRELAPTRTAAEQAAEDERKRVASEARARQEEERRRDRALLVRYPSQAIFDQERLRAIAQVDEVIGAAQKRVHELADERAAIDLEMEFYKKDPSNAPGPLKRRAEDHAHSVAVQKRFIVDQESEKKRVGMRFDEELSRLRQLWAHAAGGPSAPTARVAASSSGR